VARLKSSGRRTARRQEHRGEVAVLNSGPIFAALPYSVRPLLRPFQLLGHDGGELAVLAVENRDCIDWRRIGDRQIAEAAQPAHSSDYGRAIELPRRLDAHNIRG